MNWKTIEIPLSLIGETKVTERLYHEFSTTQVLLPANSGMYAGYGFLHPSKLISKDTKRKRARLTYNDQFTFHLIKHDREPRKRYKRYTLTAEECIAIYQPLADQLALRDQKKADAAARQPGDILLICDLRKNQYQFVFHVKGKIDGYTGAKGCHYQIHQCISQGIPRRAFSENYSQLLDLEEQLRVITCVQDSLEGIPSSVYPAAVPAKERFGNLCEEILEEICQEAIALFYLTPGAP